MDDGTRGTEGEWCRQRTRRERWSSTLFLDLVSPQSFTRSDVKVLTGTQKMLFGVSQKTE